MARVNILVEKAYYSPTACGKYLISSQYDLNFSATNTNFNNILYLNQEKEQGMLESQYYFTMVGENLNIVPLKCIEMVPYRPFTYQFSD